MLSSFYERYLMQTIALHNYVEADKRNFDLKADTTYLAEEINKHNTIRNPCLFSTMGPFVM